MLRLTLKKMCLEKGKGRVTIKNTRLWWIRGFGEQYLYDLKIWIENEGKVIDSVNKKIGLRTLTMSTERYSDESGEFCFVINRVKIFTMGANYVPQDIILSRITPESTEELIKLAVDANFNCLRVWGADIILKMNSMIYVINMELRCGRILCLPVRMCGCERNFCMKLPRKRYIT